MIILPKNQPFIWLSSLPFLWLIQISPILFLLSPRFLRHHFIFSQPPTSSSCSTFQIPLAMASEEGFPCLISPHLPLFSSCHTLPNIYYLFIKVHQNDLKRLLFFTGSMQSLSSYLRAIKREWILELQTQIYIVCSLCDLNKLPPLDFSYLILKLG